MSEENPYQTPSSPVEPAMSESKLGEPQSLSPGHGMSWISAGWRFFTQSPLVWVGMIILFWVIIIVISVIPLVSILTTILLPIFTAGLILACRDLEDGKAIDVGLLFAGFKNRTGDLAALGAINLGLYFILGIFVLIVMMGTGFAGGMFDMDPGADPIGDHPMLFLSAMFVPMIIVALVIVPIIMLFWFSPAILVLNEEVGVIDAMKLSFIGCLKNILPLTIYSLVFIGLAIIASIPLMLGWLALGPLLYGSLYASYKDIYIRE